jgi:Secretion system C-terminal sorting domain/YHYH protein
MRKTGIIILAVSLMNICANAHVVDYGKVILHHWNIPSQNATVEGSFYMMKDGKVFIDKANNEIVSYPLNALSKDDEAYAMRKQDWVRQINHPKLTTSIPRGVPGSYINFQLFFTSSLVILLLLLLFSFLKGWGQNFISREKVRYAYPILLVGIITTLFSFNKAYRTTTITNPAFLDSAFAPYSALVTTAYDSTYYYVSSHGIPTQEMMAGITAWQQQVPIPQCYLRIDSNAWSIPLNPVLADTPIPTATNFFRGAIAIAVNGVDIFNALTNVGVDAYLAGQLDSFGGHCGRADDYHYHIAPLVLQSTSGLKPIAFAFDGFAVYGSREPDGSAMAALDTNHGHFWSGVYHYHGNLTYPYMIGNMVGRVTEDTTSQIVPQAHANPVRGPQVPLTGAIITNCRQIGTNGYQLTYTLGGVTDTVTYNWTPTGTYTFIFSSPTSPTRDSVYTGFIPCYVLPTETVKENLFTGGGLDIYPNPANEVFSVILHSPLTPTDVLGISVYNMIGQLVYHSFCYTQNIDTRNWAKGNYIVKVQLAKEQINKKLVLE